MSKSNIEWTEITWNPTTGCTKISDGCLNCYAEPMSKRLQNMGIAKYWNAFKLTLHPDEINRPYEWKRPKLVFVNSMSDLFHPIVPVDFIQQVFEVMNKTPQHTYQVLTKRPERLLKLSNKFEWTENIWMGTTVENEMVSPRIVYLSATPAKTKFLSCEPLIGHIKSLPLKEIDWVIVGGESGQRARPIKKEWIETIKRECIKYNVPFFFKQWGKQRFNVDPEDPTMDKENKNYAKGGCQLDGAIYRQMPQLQTSNP